MTTPFIDTRPVGGYRLAHLFAPISYGCSHLKAAWNEESYTQKAKHMALATLQLGGIAATAINPWTAVASIVATLFDAYIQQPITLHANSAAIQQEGEGESAEYMYEVRIPQTETDAFSEEFKKEFIGTAVVSPSKTRKGITRNFSTLRFSTESLNKPFFVLDNKKVVLDKSALTL